MSKNHLITALDIGTQDIKILVVQKKGDKRNLACKAPPPVNHFQSNNDLNLFFKNIFRGLGIFVFTKTPPYAKMSTGVKQQKTLFHEVLLYCLSAIPGLKARKAGEV